MYMFESKCLEHNSKQTRAKFSVLFKVHFFRPAEDSSLPISASIFDFFSCNITIKPIVLTRNWFLLDEF